MGRIILTPSGPRHPLEARAPAVRNEATVIILLAVHSSIYWKVTVSDPLGLLMIGCVDDVDNDDASLAADATQKSTPALEKEIDLPEDGDYNF